MLGPAGTSIIHVLAALSCRAENWERNDKKPASADRKLHLMGAGLCSELSCEFESWRQGEDQGGGERQRWQQLSHLVGLEFGVWFCCCTNSGLARGVSSVRTEGSFADELHRISPGSAACVSQRLICSLNIQVFGDPRAHSTVHKALPSRRRGGDNGTEEMKSSGKRKHSAQFSELLQQLILLKANPSACAAVPVYPGGFFVLLDAVEDHPG